MSFVDSIKSVLSKYATFSGRARRSELWWYLLAVNLSFVALGIVFVAVAASTADPVTGDPGAATLVVSLLFFLVYLSLILPTLAVQVRRLHDGDRSGWWILLSLVPVGNIVLLVFYALEGTRGPNRFGPDPKGETGYGIQPGVVTQAPTV
ncbi:DUF805 domain-containing protein [Xylanimonas oleitrophica]|uniref:DUF805 domain-containing protein n=1 Tax=Xylanimonas oleitrophica TaxID=2607479 RepID=A0A2W5WRV7_9MICO|nr:DUF805 domain-containing protein [Xylanimonas oleitrophica]PZR53363.1 DUF805 domain-containing protein [Xylanimonas oleitrophica]